MHLTKKKLVITAFLIFSLLFLFGCKIVKHSNKDKSNDPNQVEIYFVSGDFNPTEYVDSVWEKDVVPTVLNNLNEYNVITDALKSDLDSAFKNYGYREDTEGKLFNFYVTSKATILKVEEGFNSKLHLDVEPFDGKTDLYLMTGPIIRGDTLRDGLEFLKFDDFKNQLEFGRLSKSLNKKAYIEVIKPIINDLTEGKIITFSGVFGFENHETMFNLVPISIEIDK